MYTAPECRDIPIFSPTQLRMLFFMWKNNNRANFRSQRGLFGSQRVFNIAMNELKIDGLVEHKNVLIKGRYCNEYILTFNGAFLVKEYIDKHAKNFS